MFAALNSNPDNLLVFSATCMSIWLSCFVSDQLLPHPCKKSWACIPPDGGTRSCKSLPQCHRELETGRDTLTLKWLDSKAGMKFYSWILRVLYPESQWWSSLEIVLYIYWNSDGECLFSSTFGEKRTIPFGILKPSELRSLKLSVKRAVNTLLVSAFL